MTNVTPIPPTRLRVASMIVIGAALLSIGLSAFSLLTGGWPRAQTSLYLLLVWVPITFFYPACYITAAIYLQRGRFGALVALFVIPSSLLIDRLSNMVIRWRFYGPWIYSAIGLVVPLIVLAGALWARPTFALLHDPLAVERARRRSTIGLYIAAGVVVLLAILLVVMVVVWSGEDVLRGDVMAILATFVLIAFGGAFALYRMARRSGRGERLGVGWIIFAIIFGAVVLWFGRQTFLRGFYYNHPSIWIDTAISAAALWLTIDLLHARRRTVELQSYGFEPIFARPVEPLPPEV